MTDHTFAVCAYGESPFLETCVRSLLSQTVPSEVILCTSTPNAHIRQIAKKYGLPLFERDGESGIGRDWNFAYSCADSTFVTLAHQDDVYGRHYGEQLRKAVKRWPDLSLYMTASVTVKNREPLKKNGMTENIKCLLRLPLRFRFIADRYMVKRAAVCLGNPVICPSVTYRKESAGERPFAEDKKFILDWLFLWENAAVPGRWVMEERPLMLYRVHDGAATADCIRDSSREREETEMFSRIWPAPLVRFIMHFYRRAYDAYR